jgi:hypothetical protein
LIDQIALGVRAFGLMTLAAPARNLDNRMFGLDMRVNERYSCSALAFFFK